MVANHFVAERGPRVSVESGNRHEIHLLEVDRNLFIGSLQRGGLPKRPLHNGSQSFLQARSAMTVAY